MKVGNITFDCTDVLRVARFWSAVLERPLDERSGEHFASIGGADPERIEPALYHARSGGQRVLRFSKGLYGLDVADRQTWRVLGSI